MLGNARELVAHDLELQGKKRCVRGGCWQSGAADVRCATRYGAEGRYWGDGFRLTADLPAKDE